MKRALTALGLLAASLAHAEPAASVRVGDHPGFGRVVFDFAAPTSFQLSERRGRVVVTFSGGPAIGMPDAAPRNVLSVLGGEGSATLTIAPGARIRAAQMGNRVVLDILDPAPRARPPAPATPITAQAPAAPAASQPEMPPPVAEPPPPPSPSVAAPDVLPLKAPPAPPAVVPDREPVEQVKRLIPETPAPPSVPTPGPLRVPAGAEVGVAAFRRGDLGVVVFDDQVTIDAAQFDQLVGFAGATTRTDGRSTVLVVPVPAESGLEVVRNARGWTIRPDQADIPAAETHAVADGIAFSFAQTGRTVSVRDPLTGQGLLVGTIRGDAKSGRAVTTVRRAPGYVLLPTWLGLALEPNADEVALRASADAFTLVTPDSAAPARTAAAVAQSELALPTEPAPALLRELHAHMIAAAALPPRARGRDRVDAARMMLGLGMNPEAQALLALAAEEDPSIANDRQVTALAAVAAILADRPADASGLDRPELEQSNELTLWRGLRDARQGKPASGLARFLPVVLGYPEAVRAHVLPLVVESGVRDGQSPLADERLSKLPALDYARALQAEQDGKLDEALAGYDAVDQGRDVDASFRAAAAAAELRLAKGRIGPGEAANVFDRLAFRWRGDGRELQTRLRLADLRTQAGQWRVALDSLRETEAFFPDAKAEIGARKAGVFKAVAAAGQNGVSALELVTLAADYADSLPGAAEGEALAALLADKLIALDLPSRALPILQRLMTGAKSAGARAEFALALAQLHLDLSEPAKSETVLKGLNPQELSPDRADARLLLLAKSRAGQGDPRGATVLLAGLVSPAAGELRASLSAQSGDWKGSLKALGQLAAKLVPAEGELNDAQQDVLLREAVAAVQAGDGVALEQLKSVQARLTGPRADQFRLLTATALQSTADLPRAASELALSRSFSGRLDQITRR